MRYRVLFNPVFSLETGELLSHDGESYVESFAVRLDRSVQQQAKGNQQTANSVAGQQGQQAAQIGSELIPGLERDANNPTGFTPTEKSAQLVSSGEAIGGANAGVRGEANLEAARTRNAGGFANALDEAARIKSRQLGTNALKINIADAQLAHQKQEEARRQLQGLYGTSMASQLKAMGLSDEAIQQELAAGRQGWLQNTEGVLDTLEGGAKAAFPKGFQG